jgi:plastocyanin
MPRRRKLIAGAVTLSVALGVSGVAVAAKSGAPAKTTIEVSQTFKVKPNRYIQDGLRWNKDVYHVRSGGTITVVNTVATEGPHTLSVVKKSELPKTAAQVNNCKICGKIAQELGVTDPNDPNAQPKFQYAENGVGTDTPPDVDRPGDTGVTGPGKKGEKITLKVTAKKGTTLYFMCAIHPWMEAKLIVG